MKKPLRYLLYFVLLLAAIGLVVVVALGYLCNWNWVGVVSHEKASMKTLWDWMDLLIVPIVIAVGAWFLNHSEREGQRKIEDDRQRQSALEAYLNTMTGLLLEKELRESKPAAEVRTVARTRTLAVLRILDKDRKAQVLQFLSESNLIKKNPVVDLKGANLQGADLEGAFLKNAEIRGAYLNDAQLTGATLQGADLRGSDLCGAKLAEANLRGSNLGQALLTGADLRTADLTDANLACANFTNTNLVGAHVTEEQLDTTEDLRGATMPDGKKHKEGRHGQRPRGPQET